MRLRGFLAGITSRGYDDNQFFCSEGGIYVRPDKDELVAWIEAEGGVELPVGRGPKAAAFTVTAGGDKTVTIDADDPRAGRGHGFEIVTGPAHGTATITADGKLTVSAAGDYLGDDVVEVRAIDTDDATRSARGRIHYAVTEDSGGVTPGTGRHRGAADDRRGGWPGGGWRGGGEGCDGRDGRDEPGGPATHGPDVRTPAARCARRTAGS